MKFVRRRIRNTIILAIAIALTWYFFKIVALSLHTQQFYSGWLVAGLIVFLLSFYVKKKFNIIPLGSNSNWAQWHYYCGYFLIAAFAIHVEFAFPDGNVERILGGLLALVVFVGIAGAVMNRVFARRLAFLGEEIIFERIPEHMAKLRERLETELAQSVEESNSSTLSSYYAEHLAGYFSTNRDILSHLAGNPQPHLMRLNDLELQMRYLNQREAAFAMQLADYLDQKNTLDTHYALQGAMKYWGVLHAPIGLILLFMVFVHVVLVYAFRGAV